MPEDATHDGELMGIPPSGQRVSSDGMVFARFEDGMVVERWGVQDMLTLLQQIGAFAAVGATGCGGHQLSSWSRPCPVATELGCQVR
jgi:hypothetical protein